MSVILALLPSSPAWSQIAANHNAPATQQPTILKTANGLPQVDIQTPNGAGVSMNRYSQFDVDKHGAILDNSRTDAKTQLGGWVKGNPWLAGGAAKVIVNQIDSSQPSRLNGYIEVAGQKADVVIANPSGIAIDGGGFINAGGVTLTTGTPLFGNNGALAGFDVHAGTITVDGAGFDASHTDYAALISRAVKVNAAIWAKQLDITTGANHVAYGLDGAATPGAGSGQTPGVAIDVASLGSMYAHSIYLVGTDNGVGVSNAGVIDADTGDLHLSANGQLTNTGQLRAGGNATLHTAGVLDNGGSIDAGQNLMLAAASLTNETAGSISAVDDNLAIGGALNNTGLIDGTNTFIQANTLNNLGSGRIYGGHLAIQVDTLDNGAQGGQAGTLAARDRLDLGVGTLNNTGGALIYSAGDLAIGGALDGSYDASGSAGTVTNSSSSIEAAGNLSIDAAILANLNATFATQVVDGQAHGVTSYYTPQGWISSVGWMVDTSQTEQKCVTVGTSTNGTTDCSTVAVYAGTRLMSTGSGYGNPVFKQYYGTAAYVPGSMSTCSNSGGGNNHGGNWCIPTYIPGYVGYSGTDPIWAAFGLTAPGYNLPKEPQYNNSAWLQKAQPWVELQSKINALDAAVASAPLYDKNGGYYANGAPVANLSYTYHDRVAQVTASNPGVISSGGDMNLLLGQKLTNDESQILAGGALNVSGQQIDNLSHQIQADITQAGTVNTWGVTGQHWGGWLNGMSYSYGWLHSAYNNVVPATLTAPSIWKVRSHDAATATHSVADLNLPNASLYSLQPPSSAYLIETDPAFTNERQWLSSDYMLKALAVNPATVQQRLGDGFYEQQLINQQVARLTGQYALPGYSDTQSEYQALMNNGVTEAKSLGLHVGLALTAKQVSELTSNIVWLVDKTVTLPDGSMRTELAPQVYVAGQSGELKGDGTLIAGRNIDLKAGGTFTNSGSLRAAGSLAASAKDIQNLGGDINATTVALAAQNDLNNIGGSIGAVDALSLTAGHDLTLQSTTEQGSGHSATGKFSSTTLGRTATVYVSGPNGTLTAQAGHDLTLEAAQVKATGAGSSASLAAGHDLALNAVTTASRIDAKWSNSDVHIARSKTVGSRISAGSLSLAAGNDLSATAAQLKATDANGTLALQAGHDIALNAGAQTSSFAASSAVSGGNALFGEGSLNRSFTTSTSTALGTRLSGAHIATVSGGNTTVVGGRLNAADTLAMTAVGSLNLLAGTDRFSSSYLDSEGYGSTFAGQSTTTDSLSRTTAHGTQLNGGRIALQSGGDTTLQAAAIDGQSFSATAGRINGQTVNPNAHLNIDAAIQDYSHSHSDQSASLLTQSMDGKGTVKQTLRYTTITLHGGDTAQTATASDSGTATGQDTVPTPDAANGQGAGTTAQPTFAATGGITVGASTLASAGSGSSKASGSGSGSGATPTRVVDLRQQAEQLAKQPGMGYLKQLTQRKDVNWQKVQLEMQHWDYSQSGLTPAAAAIIAIVVTVVSAGAAADAAGAMVSTATGASATATATSAAVTSALSTGMTTLASEAAVSLANNGGDVSKTLKDLGSKQSVRNLVASMLTAGATTEATLAFHLPNPAADTNFADRLKTYATQDLTQAGVTSVVYGQPLDKTVKQGLINAVTQDLTSQIGDLQYQGVPPGSLIKIVAHAAVGCASAQVSGQRCSAAAEGAAVAEALSPLAGKVSAKDGQQWGQAVVEIGSVLAASLTGQNVNTALGEASTVDAYNRQLHPTEEVWLQTNAKAFAAEQCDCKDPSPSQITLAKQRLTQQALRDVDLLWRATLKPGNDSAAQVYLSTAQGSFINDAGKKQALFTDQGMQYLEPALYGDQASLSFYQAYAQPGVVTTANAGLTKYTESVAGKLGHSLMSDPLGIAGQIGKGVVTGLVGSAKALFTHPVNTVTGAFESGGTTLGETAASWNGAGNAMLNRLYGQDVTGAQRSLQGLDSVLTLTGMLGSGKILRTLGEATVKTAVKATKVTAKIAAKIAAKRAEKAAAKGAAADVAKEIPISKTKYGEAASHIADAQKTGHPDVLTVARDGAPANRKASIGGLPKVPGKQLDEYPPAMFKEGGTGASVRAINPRDNMAAGACIGNACRGLSNGEKVRIKVVE